MLLHMPGAGTASATSQSDQAGGTSMSDAKGWWSFCLLVLAALVIAASSTGVALAMAPRIKDWDSTSVRWVGLAFLGAGLLFGLCVAGMCARLAWRRADSNLRRCRR